MKEIEALFDRGVFTVVKHDPKGAHKGVRVYKSRLVNEVKGKTIETPYKKSRLVIQAFNYIYECFYAELLFVVCAISHIPVSSRLENNIQRLANMHETVLGVQMFDLVR